MATTKVVVVALWACLMVGCTMGQISEKRLSYRAQQCQINRLTSSQPNQRIECEGGLIEMWDENEEQYQCSGINAMKITVQPNSLSLPNYQPFPRLVYIERGEGLLGVSFPGCPETYHSTQRQGQEGFRMEEDFEGEGQGFEQHQKVHRFKKGDILAIPAGFVHWCYNDGNDDFVAIVVNDLNNQANQLDSSFKAFYLSGGLGRSTSGQQGGRQGFQVQNIFSAFDTGMMANAFNVPADLIRRMQQTEDRTLIVRVEKGEMRVLSPERRGEFEREEEEEYRYRQRSPYMGLDVSNLIGKGMCTMKLRHSLDSCRDADVYSRQGGSLHILNEHKLPILRQMDMSAEKGHMYPNTIYSPHWAINSHSIVYVTRGDAQVQVVGNNGETIMDERVQEGEMFVIPQYFTSTCRAGNDGFEYVSFKTTSSPMKSPVIGHTSVFRAMPVQVLTNVYQISPSEARQLKYNRQHQTFFLPSTGIRSARF